MNVTHFVYCATLIQGPNSLSRADCRLTIFLSILSITEIRMRNKTIGAALLIAPLTFCALAANAACCPSDGNGSQIQRMGLGERRPAAPDLAIDSTWNVYQFERDGIRYVQINDRDGHVRAAVGRIEDLLWVLPVGSDADRVSTPGNPAPEWASVGQVIFRSGDLMVRWHESPNGDAWSFTLPELNN
jgi:hypothetical protein